MGKSGAAAVVKETGRKVKRGRVYEKKVSCHLINTFI